MSEIVNLRQAPQTQAPRRRRAPGRREAADPRPVGGNEESPQAQT